VRQARWRADGIELVELSARDLPPLRPDWLRLRVQACGICGSDLHALRGDAPVPVGRVPGHEIACVRDDGALVAVEPRLWCGTCAYCRAGERQLCREGRLLGVDLPGGFADFVDAPLACVHAVPAGIDAAVAALAEPLAVCVRALARARVQPASRVLVLGGGSLGLLAGLLARDRAASTAVAVRHAHQRDTARRFGLTALGEPEVDAWAREHAPDVVIETVGGRADTLARAVDCCAPAGRIAVLGLFAPGAPPPDALALALRELTLVGSNTYGTDAHGSEFAAAVALLPRYRAELAALHTHRFGLNEVREAFATAADKHTGAIKVVVEPRL
jgi:threonine dehydrogenase-like Zn-dependent dehydrogenase